MVTLPQAITLSRSLASLFERDLATLAREVEAYPDDTSPWAPLPGVPNPGGVLVRHLCGNLQQFVGAVLGGSGYRRDREAEFAAPPWPRARLLAEVAATRAVVLPALAGLTAEQLASGYPLRVLERDLQTADFLIHLAVHLGFHTGQVDYHRRAVTGDPRSVGPTAIPALASARP